MKRLLCLTALCCGVPASAQSWLSAAVPGTGWLLQQPGTPATAYQVRATDWTADRSRLIVRLTPVRLTGEPALTGAALNGYLYAQGDVAWIVFEDGPARYACGVPLAKTPPPVYPQASAGRSVRQAAQGSEPLPQGCLVSRTHRTLFVKLTALPQPQLRQVWQLGFNGLIQTRYNVVWGAPAPAGQATAGAAYDVEAGQAYRAQHQTLPGNQGSVVTVQIGEERLSCVTTPADQAGSGYAGMIYLQEPGKADPTPTLQDCDLEVMSP